MADENTANNAGEAAATTDEPETTGAGADGVEQGEGARGQEADLPGWLAGVKQDYRDSVKGFKTPTDLVTDYLETKSKLENAVFLPGEDADEQERVAFLSKLGVPETKDGYELQQPQDLPKGMEYDRETETWFRDKAHELGLSKNQAEQLYAEFNDRQVKAFTTTQAERERKRKETEEALREQYGDKYDTNMELARRAVRQLGTDDFDAMLERTGLTNDPAMVRFFVELGQRMGPDSVLSGGHGLGVPSTDPNDTGAWDMPNSFPEG